MRKTGVCPKCAGDRLLLVGTIPDIGELETQFRPMHLAMLVVGHGSFGSEKRAAAGRLSAVMCRGCGFAELYVLDPEAIEPDGKYVTELKVPAR